MKMKNLMMSVAVGALMLPSLGWSAADGRGHNGPNLAPVSIPVALDHGISAAKVQEAIGVCFGAGDSKTGVVALARRLADQLTGGHGGDAGYMYYGWATEYELSKAFYGQAWIKRDKAEESPTLLASGYGTFTFLPGLSYFEPRSVTLQFSGQPPIVRYQSVVQDTGFDEYGREQKGLRILMGVSISYDPSTYGTAVRLVNSQTGVKSAITVNTVEYVECLKNELQKRAE